MSALRNSLYRQIHASARSMGLDEDGYRDRLFVVSGSRSASALTDDQLRDAAAKFPVKQSNHVSQDYLRKLKALWIACWNLGALDAGSDAALDAFVKRQTGKDKLQFLTPSDANAVTEALKAIAARSGFEVPANDHGGMKARIALVEAQWRKMGTLKLCDGDTIYSLGAYITKAFPGFTKGAIHLKRHEADKLASTFGRKIRSRQ